MAIEQVRRVLDEVVDLIHNHFPYRCTSFHPKLKVDCSCRVLPRHFACVDTSIDPPIIYVCKDLEHQGISTIRGVIAHECGHCLYDIYGVAHFMGDPELGADEAAWFGTGWTIYYDPETLIQRAGPGARGLHPRPSSLW